MLVVVERHDQPLLLRQQVEGSQEHVPGLLLLELGLEIDRVWVGETIGERGGLLVVPGTGLVERDQHRAAHVVEQAVEVAARHLELAGQLVLRRRPAEPLVEPAGHAVERARLAAHRARHPVERAQLVEHRPLDAPHGVGLELDPLAGVELGVGIEQAEHPGRVEILVVDVPGQRGGDALDHVAHQRREPPQQLVLRVGDRQLDARRLGRAGPHLARRHGGPRRLRGRGNDPERGPRAVPRHAVPAGAGGRTGRRREDGRLARTGSRCAERRAGSGSDGTMGGARHGVSSADQAPRRSTWSRSRDSGPGVGHRRSASAR